MSGFIRDVVAKTQLAASSGAAIVGYDGRTVDEQLKQVTRIENIHALRDFFKSINAFNTVENSTFALATYGDSVSTDVGSELGKYLMSLIGRNFNNITTWGGATFGTPQSIEYTGGAAHVQELYTNPSFTYLPTGTYYDVPSGGAVTFGSLTTGDQSNGFTSVKCYVAKIPGGGTATVDLLDQALTIVATQVINTANATIDATKAEFTGLDVAIKYRVRVTASVAGVVVLGIAKIKPRGLTGLVWKLGGTTLDQQNTTPKTIFDYINLDLGVKLVVSEFKGEASLSNGLPDMLTRLSALSTSVILIGSRPDVQSEAQQTIETRWVRQNAIDFGCAFVDAYHILKDYAELTRLGWGGDGTHLAGETARYVAALIIKAIPTGAMEKFYITNDVVSSKVMALEFSLQSPSNNSVASRIPFAKPYGGAVPTAIVFNNVARMYSGTTAASQSIGAYSTGMAVFQTGDMFGDLFARSIQVTPGSTSLSTVYALRAANGITGGSFLVAALPATAEIGGLAYASDGRKVGEGVGAGTGVPVYRSAGGLWRRLSDDTQVLA